jgi:hypothetical protein
MQQPRSIRDRRRVRLFALAGVLAVLVAAGGDTVIDAFARQVTYPAPPVSVPSPPPAPLREIALQTAAGELSAWWLPPPPGAPVVLLLHGNAENLETMRLGGLLAELAALPAGVLAIDFPGYGRSAGTPSERTLVDAAEVAWRWLGGQAAGSPRAPRVLVGWSLGAAVAVQVAARHRDTVDAVILLSPWDSLHAVAARYFPAVLVRGLSDRYDSVAAGADVRGPTLVVHGERDDIIPIEHGRRLFDALREPKRWVAIGDAGHNDLLAQPSAWRAMAEFLEALPGGGTQGKGLRADAPPGER